MKRVTRDGGLVVSADLDGNYMFHYPIEPRLEDGLRKVMNVLALGGFDPWVGRKLYSYYREAGFSQIKPFLVPHHLITGKPSKRESLNWHEKIDTIREKLSGVFPESDLKYLSQEFKRLIDSPDTFTYSSLIIMVGVK